MAPTPERCSHWYYGVVALRFQDMLLRCWLSVGEAPHHSFGKDLWSARLGSRSFGKGSVGDRYHLTGGYLHKALASRPSPLFYKTEDGAKSAVP